MGNNTSEVNDSLKAQAGGAGGPELYTYANVSGGGLLIDLMKTADITKDYTEIDEIIRTKVSKFLYNDGKGQDVPISELVLRRTNGKAPTAVPGKCLKLMFESEDVFCLNEQFFLAW